MSGIYIGREFTNWKVIGPGTKTIRKSWRVKCQCGTEREVGEYQLLNALSRSCGCRQRAIAKQVKMTHGESAEGRRSPELRAYQLAKAQCENPAHPNYPKFGAAGIRFLFADFASFLNDIGRKPGIGFVLTRSNSAGDYAPGNLIWTKNRNRRSRQQQSI